MPLYAYYCDRCNTKFEFWRDYQDAPETVCPDCETATLRKLFGATPIHFKGGGFYATDNALKTAKSLHKK